MKRHANMMSDKEQTEDLLKKEVANESSSSSSSAPAPSAKNDQLFRLFLLFLMTAQNSSVVLLSRYTRAGVSSEDLYVINDMVMVSEMAKVRYSVNILCILVVGVLFRLWGIVLVCVKFLYKLSLLHT
jgi:hypothetical protein